MAENVEPCNVLLAPEQDTGSRCRIEKLTSSSGEENDSPRLTFGLARSRWGVLPVDQQVSLPKLERAAMSL